MALDPVPWMIGNGLAVHSAEVGRLAVFGYAKDANGVIMPTDMLVRQTSTPGSNVRVAPGGAMLFNSYTGGLGQSYVMRNATETLVGIPATGSGSGATRYLIAYVTDPMFGGGAPANPVTGPYVFLGLVSTLAGITYPYVPLAKIVQPASTATITTAMITDIRECAQPRQKTIVVPRPSLSGDQGMTLTSRSAYPDGEWFPNHGGDLDTGAYYVDIPKWATRMQIRMEWLSVKAAASASYGNVWVSYGPTAGATPPTNYTQAFGWDYSASTQQQRMPMIVHQEVAIPAAWRGTNQPFVPRATRTSPNNSTYNGAVALDGLSGLVFSLRFLEVADQEI